MTFEAFFEGATDNAPLPYQRAYASSPFESTLILVPTGLGKTWTVLVPWLHRVSEKEAGVPTRLFLVLPRQNLTEQTYAVATKAVAKANLSETVKVIELMGSSEDNDLKLGPEKPTIIVCTQDMYLSRALNRGYARRPLQWPIDFALFNQDCLIVFDEVQLMSDGLATTTQLAAFRERYGIVGTAPCIWMSATLNPEWLDTVDFRSSRPSLRAIELTSEDHKHDIVKARIHAPKTVQPAPESCRTPEGCAAFVLGKHREGERTLVITNTVQRAKQIFDSLGPREDAILLHARFRPGDRHAKVKALDAIGPRGQIVVATQVLEAGIDIDSSQLITDAAPWGSLVQRFGRVNRKGGMTASEIWWVDQPLRGKLKPEDKNLLAPYQAEAVEAAISKLKHLQSASPAGLPPEDGAAPWRNVLRRSDLLDLFDTTPDLAGNAVDVSRFIRSGEEKDCYLAWRDFRGEPEEAPEPARAELQPEELCPVPIGELREWAKKRTLYSWNFGDKKWVRAGGESIFPGMLLLTDSSKGGYTAASGWSPESKGLVPAPPRHVPKSATANRQPEGDEDNPLSWTNHEESLTSHTNNVVTQMAKLLQELDHLKLHDFHADLRVAARKHDWGKAHPVFQETLGRKPGGELLAKQERSKARPGHSRKNFRHELASALAMVAAGDTDLSAYIVAAHHGRIRVCIRSMPGDLGTWAYRVRGIEEGDTLPTANLGAGTETEPITLTLKVVPMGSINGGNSWSERTLRLRDEVGPFRLAFLEMLLRVADNRASAQKDAPQ